MTVRHRAVTISGETGGNGGTARSELRCVLRTTGTEGGKAGADGGSEASHPTPVPPNVPFVRSAQCTSLWQFPPFAPPLPCCLCAVRSSPASQPRPHVD